VKYLGIPLLPLQERLSLYNHALSTHVEDVVSKDRDLPGRIEVSWTILRLCKDVLLFRV
jgi:hypothetical protein